MWHLASTLFKIISDSMYVITMLERRHLRSESAVAKKVFMENFAKKVIDIQTGAPVQVRTTKLSGFT